MMVSSYSAKGEAFVATKPRLWAEQKNLEDFDLAPNGKRFAVVQTQARDPKATLQQLTVFLNFFDELRRRAPAAGK
jgi:hypothetical protein